MLRAGCWERRLVRFLLGRRKRMSVGRRGSRRGPFLLLGWPLAAAVAER